MIGRWDERSACGDGGIKALLTGRVEKLDSTYLLSVQVVDPSQGQAVATASYEAAGQKEVLTALRSLSNWSRETLGEKLALIQESEKKLEKVTTPSLRAVQLFTDARTVFDRGPEGQGPAEELLLKVLEIDPELRLPTYGLPGPFETKGSLLTITSNTLIGLFSWRRQPVSRSATLSAEVTTG